VSSTLERTLWEGFFAASRGWQAHNVHPARKREAMAVRFFI
jgi:hypothetical protein